MFPYEFYKVIHLGSIFLFLMGLAIALFTSKTEKLIKFTYFFAGLLVLVAGFGLLARIGEKVSSTWVILKVIIWAILVIMGPILAKRAQQFRFLLFYLFAGFAALAAYMAVYKPGMS